MEVEIGCREKLMCNDFRHCGLKMIDPYIFALAQKMTWVKKLTFLKKFHDDPNILWISHAPESILKLLHNTQLADSIRTWYVF